MSDAEYRKLMDGETLVNTTRHGDSGSHTKAVGFCFFAEDPMDARHWLSGIADMDWCVTFDVPAKAVKRCKATYRDVEADEANEEDLLSWMLDTFLNPSSIPSMQRTDYYCTEYSKETFHIVSASEEFAPVKVKVTFDDDFPKTWDGKLDLPEDALLCYCVTFDNIFTLYNELRKAFDATGVNQGCLEATVGENGCYIIMPNGERVIPYHAITVYKDGHYTVSDYYNKKYGLD